MPKRTKTPVENAELAGGKLQPAPAGAPATELAPDLVQANAGALGIRYLNVDAINPLAKNFKRHALHETKESILMRGVIDPIGVNRTTGNNFDGHGRVEALQEMRRDWLAAGAPLGAVPRGVIAVDDLWFVPTVDGVEMDSVEEVAAAAALNRIGELGGYDEALMAETLEWLKNEDALDATGFYEEDIDDILKRFKNDGGGDSDTNGEGEGEKGLEGDAGGQGMSTSAPASNIKQVSLLFNPDDQRRFVDLTVQLSSRFDTDNVSDTVLRALEFCVANQKPAKDGEK